MDNSNQEDFSNSAMIALLPVTTNWCRIELPHLTLVYAGEIDKDLQPSDFNDLAKDAASLAMLTRPVTLSVTGVEQFGDQEKVDVLRFQSTSELDAMRHTVEGWNKSEFPFRPHATMGPVGTSILVNFVPEAVTFDRIYVGWGEQSLTFWLKMSGF